MNFNDLPTDIHQLIFGINRDSALREARKRDTWKQHFTGCLNNITDIHLDYSPNYDEERHTYKCIFAVVSNTWWESISQDDFDDELYDDTDDDEIDYPLPDFSSSDEDDN